MTFAIRAAEDDHESTRAVVLEALTAFDTAKAGPFGSRFFMTKQLIDNR